jgi:hypothetical protein
MSQTPTAYEKNENQAWNDYPFQFAKKKAEV